MMKKNNGIKAVWPWDYNGGNSYTWPWKLNEKKDRLKEVKLIGKQ
jgi:hypothetical protein